MKFDVSFKLMVSFPATFCHTVLPTIQAKNHDCDSSKSQRTAAPITDSFCNLELITSCIYSCKKSVKLILWWYKQRRQLRPTQPLTQFPISSMGRRIRRVKAPNLSGWNKDILIAKAKKIRNSFTTYHGQMGVQPFPGKPCSTTCNSELVRQTPSLQITPSSFFPFAL